MVEKKNMYRTLVENLNKRHNLEDIGIHAKITLKWFSKKQDSRAGTELSS
jgi:hypothetical protein